MRLEHIAFNVPDVRALAAWYVENLDMRILRIVDAPQQMHFLADSAGKSLIEIYTDADASFIDYAERHANTFHLAFAVDNIESTRERLIAAGATQDGGINVTPAGDRLAFVRDPWGNAVQLVERQQTILD